MKILAIAVSAAVLALAAGVGGTFARDTASGQKKKSYDIALITNDSSDPFYVTLAAGAKAQAKAQGVRLSWQAGATIDLAGQTAVLNAVMAKKPDAIVMSIIDSKAMAGPLRKVKAARIPVITVDTDVSDRSLRLATVRSDNFIGGKTAGTTMKKLLNGKGTVGFQGYQPGIQSVDLRRTGYYSVVKKVSGFKVVDPSYDNYDLKEIQAKTSALIQRNSDLSGIFAPATNEVLGVAAAVQAVGKTGTIKVVGFDGAPDEVQQLKRGTVSALVVQKAYLIGQLGVRESVAYLAKHVKPKDKLLSFVVATKANLNTASVKRYLYKAK
jgi:ribose transport system substrate-binding protein